MKRRNILLLSLFLLCSSFTFIAICDHTISAESYGKIFSDTATIPYNKVGLLLGTSKFLANGRLNPYYKYRIDAAVELIKAGKIKYIIVSGDNGRKSYNEPVQMRDDLIVAGVDSSLIYLDYAGFRTYDSVIRLKEIFGQTSATFISQPYHNERAIYIAQREGIRAVGFNAHNVWQPFGFHKPPRESISRAKVFWDSFIGTKPRFLGPKVVIPE